MPFVGALITDLNEGKSESTNLLGVFLGVMLGRCLLFVIALNLFLIELASLGYCS